MKLKKNRQDTVQLSANLFLCTGSMEQMNDILARAWRMKAHPEQEAWPCLNFEYHEFEGETHNSEVPLALKMILPKL